MSGVKPKRLLWLYCMLALPGAGTADDASPGAAAAPLGPAWFLEIPASIDDLLVADTGAAAMYRYVRSGDDFVIADERYMSIGLNGTGKQRAWDRKTPLGVYFITRSLDTRRLHEKYGVAAYPLDYPNAWDRHRERTGSGIWLHGVDRRDPDRPPRDTDGCLALPNEEILRLAGILEPLVTPLIVARRIERSTAGERERIRLQFREAVEAWRASMANGDVQTYLSLYADDFRYRDMDKPAWAAYRLGVFDARELQGVAIDDLLLLADPEEPGLYLSRFRQVLHTADGPVRTTKRLYWRRDEDGGFRIVAEDAG